jgi:hypothetical protein
MSTEASGRLGTKSSPAASWLICSEMEPRGWPSVTEAQKQETSMKALIASVFSLAMLGAGAAYADGVGAGVNVLGVGVGAHIGSNGVGAGAHVGPVGAGAGVGPNGVGTGAHVGSASAGVGIHGRHCDDWGTRNGERYCHHYAS